MNGVILRGLKDVVVERHGEAAWTETHELADRKKRLYMPSSDYSDELVLAMLDAAVEATGLERSCLLATLGESLVADFVRFYDIHIPSTWTALDLVANLEGILDAACTANRFTDFDAPRIRCAIADEGSVEVEYETNSDLCPLLEGILDGIGEYYDEPLQVDHRKCAIDDAPSCEFRVTRIEEPGSTASQPTGSEVEGIPAIAEEPEGVPTAVENSRRA